MLVKCPDCKSKVSVNASSCPKCGRTGEFKAPEPEKPVGPIPLIFAFGIIVGIGSCTISNIAERSAAKTKCIENGLKFYKIWASHPGEKTGETAAEVAARKCSNSLMAFGDGNFEGNQPVKAKSKKNKKTEKQSSNPVE